MLTEDARRLADEETGQAAAKGTKKTKAAAAKKDAPAGKTTVADDGE